MSLRITGALAWVAVLASNPALQASPLKASRRVVNGQSVDLAPLFSWWTNHSGMRPLTAWVHVTGSVVATNGLNWVLRANVESSGREEKEAAGSAGGEKRILLRTPPHWDRAEFERLQAQLGPLKDERAKVAAVETRTKGQSKASNSNRIYRSPRSRARAAQAQETQQEAKAELDRLDKQIKAVEAKLAAYPSRNHYQVDCFALDTGQDQGGLPVYEHGTSWQ